MGGSKISFKHRPYTRYDASSKQSFHTVEKNGKSFFLTWSGDSNVGTYTLYEDNGNAFSRCAHGSEVCDYHRKLLHEKEGDRSAWVIDFRTRRRRLISRLQKTMENEQA